LEPTEFVNFWKAISHLMAYGRNQRGKNHMALKTSIFAFKAQTNLSASFSHPCHVNLPAIDAHPHSLCAGGKALSFFGILQPFYQKQSPDRSQVVLAFSQL
jgi:hypothetical protein